MTQKELAQLVGKKIKLISSDGEQEDPSIRNYYGKIGIIKSITKVNLPHHGNDHFHQIDIEWFDSGNIMLILESDKFEVLQ